jgi:hypothetical protein
MVASERDGKIGGLTSDTNWRLCEAHACCGAALRVGDIFRFSLAILEVQGGKAVEATKVIKIIGGTEWCHAGFLPGCIIKGTRRMK